MITRTVLFRGQGYNALPQSGVELTPCTITATVDGNVVFSGEIPTLESSKFLYSSTNQVSLFTCQIPLITTGNDYTLPVKLAITGDCVYLGQIEADYCYNTTNSSYHYATGNMNSGVTAVGPIYNNGDARSNVIITNVAYSLPPPPDPRPFGSEGTWHLEIYTAAGQTSTVSFDMNVSPGVE